MDFFKNFGTKIIERLNSNLVIGDLWSQSILTKEENEEIGDVFLNSNGNRRRIVDVVDPRSFFYFLLDVVLEFKRAHFALDFQAPPLDCGQYGVVFRGHIKQNEHDGNPTPVAVKTVLRHAGVEHFKVLMSELKILAYAGHSDHLANLMRAYSRNIRNHELQLCKTSLLDYPIICKTMQTAKQYKMAERQIWFDGPPKSLRVWNM